jgi:hypothetical protein
MRGFERRSRFVTTETAVPQEYRAGFTPMLALLLVVAVAVGVFLVWEGRWADIHWPGRHRGDALLGCGALVLVLSLGTLGKGAFNRKVRIARGYVAVTNGGREEKIAWDDLNYAPANRGLFKVCSISSARVRPQTIESVFFRDYDKIVEQLEAHARRRKKQMPV